MTICRVLLQLIHAYREQPGPMTRPADPEVGVTTSDDGGW
jgi:hypothetical protein